MAAIMNLTTYLNWSIIIPKNKFIEHGGIQTITNYLSLRNIPGEKQINDFKDVIREQFYHHAQFLDGLPCYFEDDNHIFVHAGLNPHYPLWKEQPKSDFLYIKGEFYHNPVRVDKTVVFGHTKTIDLHGTPEIWFKDGKIGIDGGCAYGHQMNCLLIKGSNEYHSYKINSNIKS